MVRFEPLVRCDVERCETLVEPHVGRYPIHVRSHGPSPKRRGDAGHPVPALKEERKPRPGQCCGAFGAWDCDQPATVGKRCPACAAELEASRKPKQWKPNRVPSLIDAPPMPGDTRRAA
jgi:hypothetical protein